MCLRQFLVQVLFIFLLSLNSFTAFAASQQECCVKLYQGVFLPLACGQYLGGSVLTLPERMMMRLPPPNCGQTNVTSWPQMMPVYPMFMPIMRVMPMMVYGYPMMMRF